MTLPLELYEEVLWHVALENHKDPLAIPFEIGTVPKNSTLNQCMLVNHTFAEIARGHVFASISLDAFQHEDSLQRVADALAGELNGSPFVSTMGPAGRLIQSFVIDVRPQNLSPSRVALLTRVALIVQQSPKLVTLGILNSSFSYYSFATCPSYATSLLEAILRLCLLPNVRHLSLGGLASVPAQVAFNPNLESLNLQLVTLDEPTLGKRSSHGGRITASSELSHPSLPGLKTLSISRFGRNWDRLLPPQTTSEFVDFAKAFLSSSQSQTPSTERGHITPLFPNLHTLIWTLSRGEGFYGAGLTTAFIRK